MNLPDSYEVLLFDAVRQIEDPAEQQGFLAWTLRDDPEMRQRIVAMLAAEDELSDWFDNASAARLCLADDILNGDPALLETLCGSQGDLHTSNGIPGRFRILRQIGGGGGGEVFLADQLDPIRRKVAIKVLRAGLETPDFLAAFRRECQALAMMNHPNIAVVHDVGTTDGGRPYLIMEMLDGQKITEFCDDCHFTLHQRLLLFLQVCDAIQHAHQKGVIHRDIKPGNLLATMLNGHPVVKVIDFGIASASDDAENLSLPQSAGTPAFMSPEQASGDADIDTRSDIYSLGMVLRELLVGPQDSSNPPVSPPSQVANSLARHDLAALASSRKTTSTRLLAALRGDLDAIVTKATSPDRQDRYATTAGLAMDIQRHLRHEPVHARPPLRRYRLAKLIRRNRLAFASGLLAFILLCAGFSTSTWLFFRETEARYEQSRLRGEAELARSAERRLRERAEARELCAQAAVNLLYGHTEEADLQVAGIRQGMVPSSLEAKDLFTKLGDWHRLAGRWPEAAARFTSLVESHLSVDSSDNADISIGTLYALGAICRASDWKRYEFIRNISLNRFAKSREPHVAEQVLKLVLLRPAEETSLATLSPIADVLRNSIPAERPDEIRARNLNAWSCISLALWCYRSGDFDGAISAAQHTYVMDDPWNPARNAFADSLQALATWKLGRKDEARSQFFRISQSIPLQRESLTDLKADRFYATWYDCAITVTFFDEAAELIR